MDQTKLGHTVIWAAAACFITLTAFLAIYATWFLILLIIASLGGVAALIFWARPFTSLGDIRRKHPMASQVIDDIERQMAADAATVMRQVAGTRAELAGVVERLAIGRDTIHQLQQAQLEPPIQDDTVFDAAWQRMVEASTADAVQVLGDRGQGGRRATGAQLQDRGRK